jgi:hypothetical protein
MYSTIYWQAPLWQVVVVGLASIVVLAWLVRRALSRPDPAAALAAVDPALERQPLFFFDAVRGVTCLNAGARQLLAGLAQSPGEMDRVLVATLLRAYETGQSAREPDWPVAGQSLVALPVAGDAGSVAGVVALVAIDDLSPPYARPDVASTPASDTAGPWLTLGPDLRLARSRPLVEVHTVGPDPAWEPRTLPYTEEAVLRQLVEQQGTVQPAEVLFSRAWPDESVGRHGLRADQRDRLRRLVFQLRQHVEPEPAQPRYVCTAHGVGYVLYIESDGNRP